MSKGDRKRHKRNEETVILTFYYPKRPFWIKLLV